MHPIAQFRTGARCRTRLLASGRSGDKVVLSIDSLGRFIARSGVSVVVFNPQLGPGDALLVVDVQRDFCPGGLLAVPEGDRVIAVLNTWIGQAVRGKAIVVASRDWHPKDHVSFTSRGGPWPEHCVQGTVGAELHPALALPPQAVLVDKGTDVNRDAYSAFDGTGLASLLRERGVRRVFVGGLAQDVCVRATVIDSLHSGFETHVLVEATRPVAPLRGARALREMQSSGAVLEPQDRAERA
jgi:nicotinamidase/pyrazinamidase